MNMKQKQSQAGVAMITSVLLVGVLLSIVFALSAIFIPKLKSAAETKSSVTAVYAAESMLEWCLYTNRIFPVSSPVPRADIPWTATVTECSESPVKAVGTYRGVTRAFELSF